MLLYISIAAAILAVPKLIIVFERAYHVMARRVNMAHLWPNTPLYGRSFHPNLAS